MCGAWGAIAPLTHGVTGQQAAETTRLQLLEVPMLGSGPKCCLSRLTPTLAIGKLSTVGSAPTGAAGRRRAAAAAAPSSPRPRPLASCPKPVAASCSAWGRAAVPETRVLGKRFRSSCATSCAPRETSLPLHSYSCSRVGRAALVTLRRPERAGALRAAGVHVVCRWNMFSVIFEL